MCALIALNTLIELSPHLTAEVDWEAVVEQGPQVRIHHPFLQCTMAKVM